MEEEVLNNLAIHVGYVYIKKYLTIIPPLHQGGTRLMGSCRRADRSTIYMLL